MIYEYDATNDKCPLPLVKMRVILNKMTQADCCVLRIADAGSKSDIPRYLQDKGFQYLKFQLDTQVVELRITTGK